MCGRGLNTTGLRSTQFQCQYPWLTTRATRCTTITTVCCSERCTSLTSSLTPPKCVLGHLLVCVAGCWRDYQNVHPGSGGSFAEMAFAPQSQSNAQRSSSFHTIFVPMSFGLTPVAYTGWIRQHECGKPLAKRWYAGVHDSKVFALREWRFLYCPSLLRRIFTPSNYTVFTWYSCVIVAVWDASVGLRNFILRL
jgi:hypothetical protein